MQPAATPVKETAQSFTKRGLTVHTVRKTNEYMAGTIAETDSNPTAYRLQPPLKPIAGPPSDMRSKIGRALGHLNVVTRTTVEALVENRLTKMY